MTIFCHYYRMLYDARYGEMKGNNRMEGTRERDVFLFFDRVKEKRTNRTWEKEGKKQLNLP